MKAHSLARGAGLALMLGLTLSLGGCWDDDDDEAAASTEVPDSAAASTTSFLDFIRDLGSDETSEPLLIRDGFNPPADDDGEPAPLT